MLVKSITLLFILFSFSALAKEEQTSFSYQQQIEKMIDSGTLSKNDANTQISKLQLSAPNDQKALKNQVRGVASSIKKVKIYSFENDVIEINLK